jgi:surfeit locus 1 family protein
MMSLNIEASAARNSHRSADYARPSTTGTGAESDSSAGRLPARSFRPALWPTLAAALLIPLFIAAGNWQWNKAARKAQLQQQHEARAAQSAVPISLVMVDSQALNYRRVTARGRYEPQFQVLIDNRTHNGHAGYHVVTPLRVEGSDVRLLVNRGWIPAPADHRLIPSIETPAGMVQIRGTAIIPPARFFTLGSGSNIGGSGWQGVWQNLDLERYGKTVAAYFPIQPVVVLLDPQGATPDTDGGFVRVWPQADERRLVNLGYALQWWGFAATTFFLWLILNFRRNKINPKKA